MPECLHCGRAVAASEPVCDECRQRNFAERAEDSATGETQQRFVVTDILLAINLALFGLMLIKGVPLSSPTSDQIARWGGNFGPFTLGGQWWRLLTYNFVHIGMLHLAANTGALFVLGRFAESLYGRWSFLAIYLVAGVTGGLASLLWNPMGVSAGASGALFGVVGALIATLYAGKLPMPKQMIRPVLVGLVLWAAFNLAYGFWKTGLDNAAHVGGFLTGLAIGFPLGHHLGPDRRARIFRQQAFAVALLVVAALGFVTWKRSGYVTQAERARVLITANKNDEAIGILLPVVQRQPNEAYLHLLLGEAYLRKSDDTAAEREFKRILEITPKNVTTLNTLGQLYGKQQRWQDAADAFTRAAELGKDNGYSWYNAGLMYRQLDRQEDAAAAFQRSVAKNPNFFEAWFNLGISLLSMKQTLPAKDALQHAVTLRPSNADAHLWLGNALMSTGQEQAAQAEFQKAFQIRALQQRALQQQRGNGRPRPFDKSEALR